MDSSYITAVLKSKLQSEIHTYSVVVKKEKENEEKYQKLVAKKFTTNHHSDLSSNDYADYWCYLAYGPTYSSCRLSIFNAFDDDIRATSRLLH